MTLTHRKSHDFRDSCGQGHTKHGPATSVSLCITHSFSSISHTLSYRARKNTGSPTGQQHLCLLSASAYKHVAIFERSTPALSDAG